MTEIARQNKQYSCQGLKQECSDTVDEKSEKINCMLLAIVNIIVTYFYKQFTSDIIGYWKTNKILSRRR